MLSGIIEFWSAVWLSRSQPQGRVCSPHHLSRVYLYQTARTVSALIYRLSEMDQGNPTDLVSQKMHQALILKLYCNMEKE